ncbi:Hpt domain-containing protein [Alphaproteobacteria bacterium KMM 3653]|uniref:Hpt domain-containing protein n=1 Tax=Harenicola maris TaxID=2841044 RepID=A0AAP2CNH0_9RHOB|nr:Hpt domain-containing protein [Harenicola maris]
MADWDQLKDLQEMLGTEDCLVLVDMFEAEAKPVLGQFHKGDTLNSPDQDLHFIKGSALNLGLNKLADACAELENTVATGAKVNADSLKSIAAQAIRSVQEARELLAGQPLAQAG